MGGSDEADKAEEIETRTQESNPSLDCNLLSFSDLFSDYPNLIIRIPDAKDRIKEGKVSDRERESLTAMHTSGKGSKRGSVDSFPRRNPEQDHRHPTNLKLAREREGKQYGPDQTAIRSAKEEEERTTDERSWKD